MMQTRKVEPTHKGGTATDSKTYLAMPRCNGKRTLAKEFAEVLAEKTKQLKAHVALK